MPNPELSQYHDHDTNTVYDLKDGAARSDISALQTNLSLFQYKITAVYLFNVSGPDLDDSTKYYYFLYMSALKKGIFSEDVDGACICCIATDRTSEQGYNPNRNVYIATAAGVFRPVYTDYKRNEILKLGTYNAHSAYFVWDKTYSCFYVVGLSNADLSNYYTKAETDLLLSDKADVSSLATVATTGDYDDLLNKPTIPAAQVQSDWNEADNTKADYIKNKPSLATVATSGDYDDLTNKPTIPDISTKMDKANPRGTGKLSINRKTGSTEGTYSVAGGYQSIASGADGSIALGYKPTASGQSSISLGDNTIASGAKAFAEGEWTEANGNNSHAQGLFTIADSDCQTVAGKYNIADNADTYAEIIGNGSEPNNRSNARTLDWNGNETIAGDFYFNGNNAALSSQLSDKADASALATVATSGDYDDLLNKPTIPAAQVQSDWAQSNSGAVDYIKNKPSLATVATSGDYNDLINKLSAGANISISASNEISATDTKPSDFDAATFSVTANNNTTTSFKSKTLSKGIYIFVGCAQFASNANGIRSISFSINGSTSDNYAFVMNAVSGAKTYTQIIMVFNLTQTSNTVVFQGYQNSGSNLAVTGVFETIKIL